MEEVNHGEVNGAFLFISTHCPCPAARPPRDRQCAKGFTLETRDSGTGRHCCGLGVPSRPQERFLGVTARLQLWGCRAAPHADRVCGRGHVQRLSVGSTTDGATGGCQPASHLGQSDGPDCWNHPRVLGSHRREAKWGSQPPHVGCPNTNPNCTAALTDQAIQTGDARSRTSLGWGLISAHECGSP